MGQCLGGQSSVRRSLSPLREHTWRYPWLPSCRLLARHPHLACVRHGAGEGEHTSPLTYVCWLCGGRAEQEYGGAIEAYESSTLTVSEAIFDGNLAEISASAVYIGGDSQGSVSNASFINVPLDPPIMITAVGPITWVCRLGQYMPHMGTIPATNFTGGCVFNCPSGTIGLATNLQTVDECTECPSGHHCPYEAMTAALECPIGTRMPFSGSDAETCLPCTPGQFQDGVGQEMCLPCVPGTFSEDDGAVNCIACPSGGFCPHAGANTRLVFEPCPPGSYNPSSGSSSSEACIACEPGKASPIPKAVSEDACEPCLPGFFSSKPSAALCVRCKAGTYQNIEGAVDCKPCPRHSYCPAGSSHPLGCESGASIPNAVTLFAGSESSADCRCAAGFYDSGETADKPDCQECPVGSDCTWAGSTLQTLPVVAGYYRLHASSDDIRRCPDARYPSTSGCEGTATNTSVNSGRRLQDDVPSSAGSQSAGCREGLHGVYCQLCDHSNVTSRVYYSPATSASPAQCRLCYDTARDTILIVVFTLLGVALAVVLLKLCYYRYVPVHRQQQVAAAWRRFTPHVKFKIVISYACQPRSNLVTLTLASTCSLLT